MNYKAKKSWSKHWDFIVIDMLCLQLAFVFAYWLRHGVQNPYIHNVYRNEVLVLVLVQFIVAYFSENFKNVLRRGFYKEFIATVKQVVLVTLFSVFYLFMMKDGEIYSRLTMAYMGVFYLVLAYPVRLLWKQLVRARHERKEGNKSLIILTTSDKAEEAVKTIEGRNYTDYLLSGLVLLDQRKKGEMLYGLEVVANPEDVVEYVCRSWVDELYIDVNRAEYLSQEMLDAFNEMGVTVHLKLQGLENPYHRMQYVEKMAGVTVMTFSVNSVSENSLILKRLMDIAGGLVGCILTGIFTITVGPIIYLASPGPIFFSQMRIGQNGKTFKIYKFRSMYTDAEERKAELMSKNEVADGMMFKMENDPRIIKGIGHFIRKTSIDEFPQFLNVLKGEMSLVGTRPPTLDEWEKYKLHHRLRMAMKPGITSMWQVSGRSDIKEFEEVVKLDAEYIANWNLGLDIKILFKTVGAVLKSDGAR